MIWKYLESDTHILGKPPYQSGGSFPFVSHGDWWHDVKCTKSPSVTWATDSTLKSPPKCFWVEKRVPKKMTWSPLIIIFSSLFLHVLGAMLGYTGAKCHIVGWVYILYLYIPLLNPSTSTSHSIPINNRIDTVNTDTDGRFYGTATIFTDTETPSGKSDVA